MKKVLFILLACLATAINSKAEVITVWEGSQASSIFMSPGTELYNKMFGDADGQANLAVGDVITFYYTNAEDKTQIWIQHNWDGLSGEGNSVTISGEGSHDYHVNASDLENVKKDGIRFRIGEGSCTFTKIIVTKPDNNIIAPDASEIVLWSGSDSTGSIDFRGDDNFSKITDANIQAKDTLKVYLSNVDEGDQIYIKECRSWSSMNTDMSLTAGQQVKKMVLTQSIVNNILSNKMIIQRTGNSITYDYEIRYVTIAKYVEKIETTVWENETGLAGDLRFTAGSAELNSILELLTVGSVFTIYYTDAHEVIDPSTLSKTTYNKIYVKSSDYNTDYAGNSEIIVSYDDVLHYSNGSKDFYVTQNFIDAITANGLTLQRGKTEYSSFKYKKITVTHPNTIVPGYEVLYDGAPHPIAWGKDTYPVPKRMLLNLTENDIIHVEWAINDVWDAQSWIPNCMRLVSQYNNSNTIGSNNVSINSNDDPKEKSFTLTASDIATIKSAELVFSGYYFNLTKAILEHPSRFVEVTMSADGLATFSHATEAIDVTWVPGLKAYKATVSGDKIVTERINESVPAETGLILQGEANATYRIPFAASANAVEDNVLEPTDGSEITGYVLGKSGENVGFFKVTNREVAAGKAYIPASVTSARQLSIDLLGDEATGIATIGQLENLPSDNYYNLQGQRVNAGTKGLVIVKGKKVFNK